MEAGEKGDPIFEAGAGSMQTHAVNGALATGLAQFAKFPFQAASILILPRILDPIDFGIYAMVDPFVNIALAILNFGIFQAIIQAPALKRDAVSGVFWVMTISGLVFAAALVVISPLVSTLYNEPRAGALLAVSALVLAQAGVVNVPVALLNRQMKFGWIAIINTVAIGGGLLIGIAAASAGLGYWALLLDYLATCLITFVGTWLCVGWIPRDKPDFRAAWRFYRFGGALMLSDTASLVARHSDQVLIGKFAGPVQLGFYDRGSKLALIPMQRINQLLERILLPILSRMMESGERYKRAYLRVIRQLMLFMVPGTIGVMATAPVLIPFLIGEKWAMAAPIFGWLALAALHQPVSMTMNFLFVSQARGGAYLTWSVFSAVTTIASFLVGLWFGGAFPNLPAPPFVVPTAMGAAAAYAISDICIRMPFLWWCVTRKGPIKQIDLYAAAVPFAAGGAVSFGVLMLLQRVPFPSDFLQLATSAIVGYVVSFAVVALFKSGRATMADTVHLVRTEVPRFLPFLKREAA